MTINEYNFKELEERAFTEGTAEAVNDLAKWYEKYGMQFWNGEFFSGKYNGEEYILVPDYEEDEDSNFEIAGWEID